MWSASRDRSEPQSPSREHLDTRASYTAWPPDSSDSSMASALVDSYDNTMISSSSHLTKRDELAQNHCTIEARCPSWHRKKICTPDDHLERSTRLTQPDLGTYYWSCASLTSTKDVICDIHQDLSICGYCGIKCLSRPSEAWVSRHLVHSHGFRKCDLAGKFFQPDQFRKHLKEHHAASCGGLWADILSNRCFVDEAWDRARVVHETTSQAGPSRLLRKHTLTTPLSSPPIPTTVDTVKADPLFICLTCQRSFKRRTTLRNHERTHTGEKPFTCIFRDCSQTFAQYSDQTRHQKAQHAGKTHRCGSLHNEASSWGCGKTFRRKDGLLEHHTRTKKGRQCIINRDRMMGLGKNAGGDYLAG